MMPTQYSYAIVGGGLAGGSAVAGIRAHDATGRIVMIGNEAYLPYDRPALTKGLWLGKKTLAKIFLKPEAYYDENNVEWVQGTQVTGLDVAAHVLTDARGATYQYDRLLLATGGTPRRLTIPGGDLDGISYYRYLDDYQAIRAQAAPGKTAVVIGGGFIGSEIAAGLAVNALQVTMVFPEPYLVSRVFPSGLGSALLEDYRTRGIVCHPGDVPVAIAKQGEQFVTQTRGGLRLVSDLLIVGVGITPNTELAEQAGLSTENGITVDEYLQAARPEIFAAGDTANFPYQALGTHTRVEHWDHAVTSGKHAGENLAGAHKPYDYMPYFFSDLFDFGYEAVGEVDARLETFADWQQENATGVIYYLRDGKVRGAMMCNIWNQVEAARALIRRGQPMTPEQLRGAIGKA